MTEELHQKLLSINPSEPYIWKLKLTGNEYSQLYEYVQKKPKKLDKEFAIIAIAYIAEWYKREYDGNIENPLKNISAQDIWTASELDKETYLYKTSKTQRYLESIYVLGGLPIRFIIEKKDKSLLKFLCRTYNGNEESLDKLTINENQAVAFKESIKQKASIYEFLNQILTISTESVFAKEDLSNNCSIVNQFIIAIRTVYDEVLRDKFKIEWIIDYNPFTEFIHRKLRLHLKIEAVGKKHYFLKYERAGIWNIPNLTQQRFLKVSLRFKNGNKFINDIYSQDTIIIFENTGEKDTGFEATGKNPWGNLKHIPAEDFDNIDVIITDDNNNKYCVQNIKCNKEYLQLWSMPEIPNHWTSNQHSQGSTAVIYSEYYNSNAENSYIKSFFDINYGSSKKWNFAFIDDSITLNHNSIEEITLWNKIDKITFRPKLYTDIIKYTQNKVEYVYYDESENEENTELLPVIFCKEDIEVRFSSEKEGNEYQFRNVEINNIEFKLFDSPASKEYEEWNDINTPSFGKNKIRITARNEQKIYDVLYLPSLYLIQEKQPIIRDLKENKIIYIDQSENKKERTLQIPYDSKPLNPTVSICPFQKGQNKAILEVFLPTTIKEVYLDNKVVKYLKKGEMFNLPYLLKDRIDIHDYNENGYFEYHCYNIGDLQEPGSIDKWISGDAIKTKKLTTDIPNYINIRFGNTNKEGSIKEMLYWEYSNKEYPRTIKLETNFIMNDYSILFQDMRIIQDDLMCLPPISKNDLFLQNWDLNDWNIETVSKPDEKPLLCFDIAKKYQTYFFIFNPLFNLSEEDFIDKIYKPVLSRIGNKYNEDYIKSLKRCALELGFNWEEIENTNKK